MKFQVQIYVKDGTNYVLLDLFQDESIVVKSSVQDIQDIAQVFTDFSQTFTVPASKTNNGVFKHYYNNDLDELNANIRLDSRLEINRTPFRRGQVQLEGAEIKNNQVESYKITFYGDVVTLKDLIGNDKLKDLNYATVATTYNGATVKNSITDTSDLDVRFPLITSERLWSYTGGTSTDITQTLTPLVWSELFPALKDAKILDLIQAKYGVTFVGNFLTDKRFTNCFTWWKNRETAEFFSEPYDLTFDLSTATGVDTSSPTYAHIDTANEINIEGFNLSALGATGQVVSPSLILYVTVDNLSNSDPFVIDVYKNGALYNSFQPTAGTEVAVVNETAVITSAFASLDDTYNFKVRTTGATTFDYTVRYEFKYEDFVSNPFPTPPTFTTVTEQDVSDTVTSVTTTASFDFNSSAPDITIADWLRGTLQQFNLTCYPTENELEYQIEPLQEWYQSGDTIDITQYVDTDSIKVDRPKLYNEVSFEWQESKSFINEAYKEANEKQYGALQEVFPQYDGGKYQIKLPFETLLFSNIDTANNNLIVGFCLTKSPNYKPYIPKPVKLYLQDEVSPVFFYFDDGTGASLISSYLPFGQEVVYNSAVNTLNFGSEFSTLDSTPKENSLYSVYYKPYLVNLFRSKTRIVTCKAKFPISVMTRLSLEDALIIRDKKYRINDLKTDLTNGVTNLVLISDFVPDARRIRSFTVPQTGGTVNIPIKPPRLGNLDLSLNTSGNFSSSSVTLPATDEPEQNWVLTVPSNGTGKDRYEVYTVSRNFQNGDEAQGEQVTIIQRG